MKKWRIQKETAITAPSADCSRTQMNLSDSRVVFAKLIDPAAIPIEASWTKRQTQEQWKRNPTKKNGQTGETEENFPLKFRLTFITSCKRIGSAIFWFHRRKTAIVSVSCCEARKHGPSSSVDETPNLLWVNAVAKKKEIFLAMQNHHQDQDDQKKTSETSGPTQIAALASVVGSLQSSLANANQKLAVSLHQSIEMMTTMNRSVWQQHQIQSFWQVHGGISSKFSQNQFDFFLTLFSSLYCSIRDKCGTENPKWIWTSNRNQQSVQTSDSQLQNIPLIWPTGRARQIHPVLFSSIFSLKENFSLKRTPEKWISKTSSEAFSADLVDLVWLLFE